MQPHQFCVVGTCIQCPGSEKISFLLSDMERLGCSSLPSHSWLKVIRYIFHGNIIHLGVSSNVFAGRYLDSFIHALQVSGNDIYDGEYNIS